MSKEYLIMQTHQHSYMLPTASIDEVVHNEVVHDELIDCRNFNEEDLSAITKRQRSKRAMSILIKQLATPIIQSILSNCNYLGLNDRDIISWDRDKTIYYNQREIREEIKYVEEELNKNNLFISCHFSDMICLDDLYFN